MLEENHQQPPVEVNKGFAVLMFLLYWLLYFIGTFVAFIPQLLERLKELAKTQEQLTENELLADMLTELYYPWYLNLFQLLAFLLVLFLFYRQGIHFFRKKSYTRKTVLITLGGGIGLVVITTLLESGIHFFLPEFNTANQAMLESIFTNGSVITMFIAIVILAPIIEEVVFRGIIQGVIFKEKEQLGFISCAVLFTLAHTPKDFLSFSLYFVMSLGLGAIYWKTKRIGAPIFAHMLNNLIGFVFLIFF